VKAKLITALDAVPGENSVDRIIADPNLNAVFQAECQKLGILGAAASLNRALLNLRKAGHLRGRRSRSPGLGDDDPYRFAAEMAVRHMERRDGVRSTTSSVILNSLQNSIGSPRPSALGFPRCSIVGQR
jgi:hypothetical protein